MPQVEELTARLRLDVSEFKAELEQAKRQLAGLGSATGGADKGLQGLKASSESTEKAVKKLGDAHQHATKHGHSFIGMVGDMQNAMLAMAVVMAPAAAAVGAFGAAVAGIKFNRQIESMTLGIASVVSANNQIVDAQGRQLEGSEKLAAAQQAVSAIMTKLRQDAIETTATLPQLVSGFQAAIGPAAAMGLDLEKTRKITVAMIQTMGAMSVPMEQARQEIQSILQGDIDRNSIVAKNLQLGNEEVAQWKAKGTLAAELLTRLQAFITAGKEAGKTWEGLTSTLSDNLQAMEGLATSGAFEAIKAKLVELNDTAFGPQAKADAVRWGQILQDGAEGAMIMAAGVGKILMVGAEKFAEAMRFAQQWGAAGGAAAAGRDVAINAIKSLGLRGRRESLGGAYMGDVGRPGQYDAALERMVRSGMAKDQIAKQARDAFKFSPEEVKSLTKALDAGLKASADGFADQMQDKADDLGRRFQAIIKSSRAEADKLAPKLTPNAPLAPGPGPGGRIVAPKDYGWNLGPRGGGTADVFGLAGLGASAKKAFKEIADADYEAKAEAARKWFAEQQDMDAQIRDADLEDLLDRSREERKIGEMRLRFAEQAADTLINAADIALSGEGVTTKNIASMGKSFGQEAGDAIKESAKEYGDAAGQQLGAAIKMASAWFAFILTHPPEKPEDAAKLAAALKEKQGGVLISGMKLTDEEKARALGNVGGKMTGAGGQGMSPAAEKAAQAQIAKDRKIAEDQKKFDDAALARQAQQQDLDDRLRGESKLKAAQTRLGMAQGTITKSAGNLQLGLMGLADEEKGGLAGIAAREAGQMIGTLDANQATPLNAAQRASVGEMYSKNVTRAAEAIRSGADTKGLATQLGLSEEVLQEIKTLVATGKTNAEILKKQAEDEAKRGTEQNPIVILPSSRGNVAILDANALMRQRTAGAGRAFPTGGNVRRA